MAGSDPSGGAARTYVYFLHPARRTFPADATAAELASVDEHFAYLEELMAAGRLILAGRTEEDTPTGIVVYEADTPGVAQATMENDPAVRAGVFRARIAPYRLALLRGNATA